MNYQNYRIKSLQDNITIQETATATSPSWEIIGCKYYASDYFSVGDFVADGLSSGFPNGYTYPDTLYRFSDGSWGVGNTIWYINPYNNNPSLLEPAGTHSSAHGKYYSGKIDPVPPQRVDGQAAFNNLLASAGWYVKFRETNQTDTSTPQIVDNGDGTSTMTLHYEAPMLVLTTGGVPPASVSWYFQMTAEDIFANNDGSIISSKFYYQGIRSE